MNKHTARELVKSRKAVKEKYKSLKLATSTSQTRLEQSYKPITQPLQQLISTIGKVENVGLKEEPEEFKKEFQTPKQAYETSTPTKKKLFRKTGKTPVLPSELPSFFETSMISSSQLPSIQETSHVIAESTPPSYSSDESTVADRSLSDILEQTKQTIQTVVDTPAYEQWLADFHELPRGYIDDWIKDLENKFDYNYGIVHDIERGKFFLGTTQKPVEIIGKDIKVEGILFNGTPGLYELLFKKEPHGYKKDDLDNYMDILARTNAYRRNQDPNEQVQGNASHKYITIIGPYLLKKGITKAKNVNPAFNRLVHAFTKPKPPGRITRKRAPVQEGLGITLKDNRSNTDYVYWDSINELVDRLRLLIASMTAGHTGHNNEIVSIIEELKEAKVIL